MEVFECVITIGLRV